MLACLPLAGCETARTILGTDKESPPIPGKRISVLALEKSLEWGTKIPTGVFYKNELITPYTKRITDKIPNYLENPAAKQKISKDGKPTTDISELLDSLIV